MEGTIPMVPMSRPVFLFFRFISVMFRVDAKRMAGTLGLKMAESVILSLQVWVFTKMVNQAVSLYQDPARLGDLWIWLGVWAFLVMANIVLWPAFTVTEESLRQKTQESMISKLHDKAHQIRLEVFERAEVHDKLSRARLISEPGFLMDMFMDLYSMFGSFVTVLSFTAIMATWNLWLAFAIMVVALPALAAQLIRTKQLHRYEIKTLPDKRLLNYLVTMMGAKESAKELRVFQASNWLIKYWKSLYWKVSDDFFRQEQKLSMIEVLLIQFGIAGLMLSMVWATLNVTTGGLSAGEYAGTLIALQSIHAGFTTISDTISRLSHAFLRIQDYFDYLDMEHIEGQESLSEVKEIKSVEANRVSFHYPSTTRTIIDNLSLTIRPGERVAIVGENGSGKTTLAKLLTGLYTPTQGVIKMNELDIRKVDLRLIRNRMAVVFQDFNRYAVSLQDNIGYGCYNSKEDQEKIVKAASLGGVTDFLPLMPNGWGTMLTRQFSGGVDLSGGQWQKVAVSRAFMPNASLLLLDEPTASLDPVAETDAFRRFISILQDTTAILISHRLGLARYCDRILVLKDGKITEQGTHSELLLLNKEYARLWELQAQWYQ
ncbi:ABC transporter ATP-binding protein/permease [Paenibacillus sp. CC-CFT747]|nr:ABC transporter ATP-binding protein/permease [Paenibacillus sp. CC-CFT747]